MIIRQLKMVYQQESKTENEPNNTSVLKTLKNIDLLKRSHGKTYLLSCMALRTRAFLCVAA